jgi:septal ring factor EnvC (AmiA/AmiB activator)
MQTNDDYYEEEEEPVDEDNVYYDDSDEDFTVNSFTAATRLLEKRKEMLEIQGTLKAKRDEFQDRLKKIKRKERQLSEKRNELTDNIIELDKFIGDNEIKRTRADQKQKKEEEDKMKGEDTIKLLKLDIERQKRKRAALAEKVKRDSKYHNYLKQVAILRGGEDPENVEAIIKRYGTLEDSRNKLSKQIDRMKSSLSEMKRKAKEDNENWKKSTIELNHIIFTHGKTLEFLQKENNSNRKKAESTQMTDNELQVTLGKIDM